METALNPLRLDILYAAGINPIMVRYTSQAIPAGFPSPAADYLVEDIDLNKYLCPHPCFTFIARTMGDSMENAHIPEGALLIIDRSLQPSNNSIVVAVINNEFTVKRFIKNSSGMRLVPESSNPRYQPIPISSEMDFRVWGTVTQIIIDATKV